MNKTEHLLTCLIEECAEVQQAAAKALRFGLDDRKPESQTNNAEDIANECIDAIAVIEMLEEAGVIAVKWDRETIERKKAKVKKYMTYAETNGVLILTSN